VSDLAAGRVDFFFAVVPALGLIGKKGRNAGGEQFEPVVFVA
jgi:hypothetical protein